MPDYLSQLPGYALRRAASTLMGELGQLLETMDLRIAEATVLLLLRDHSDLTASMIGKLLDIQRANMVPLLNRLEKAGWIHRKKIDGKSLAIILTPEGRAKLAEVEPRIEAFEQDLLNRVPAHHRDHLLPALNALWQ